MQAKKGCILPGLILINGAAVTIATGVLIFLASTGRLGGYFPNWFSLFLVIFLAARLTALYAIWKMKRWGVYAFFLLECLEVIMGLFVFTSVLTFALRLLSVPTFLILLGFWYLVLKNKWDVFT